MEIHHFFEIDPFQEIFISEGIHIVSISMVSPHCKLSFIHGMMKIVNLINYYYISSLVNLFFVSKLFRQLITFLSQPNNKHNPNNKTTMIVVGLRQSNHWEHRHN